MFLIGNLKAAVFDRYAPKDKSQRRKTKITQLASVKMICGLPLLHSSTNSPFSQPIVTFVVFKPFNSSTLNLGSEI
jgi:tRNA(fMet)-specific endonuclease VapC